MFAIAFDLVVAETARRHPHSVSQAYTDVADTLTAFGFERIQGSVYVTTNDDMALLFRVSWR
jgi:virulence-associated protein VapD